MEKIQKGNILNTCLETSTLFSHISYRANLGGENTNIKLCLKSQRVKNIPNHCEVL